MTADSTRPGSRSGRGALLGLAAAALFGASAPLAKTLLPGFGPWWLAALLYSGAAVALTLWRVLVRRSPSATRLRRQDVPTLIGITVLGGVAGPLLMLVGLGRMSAVAGSLLLNLEAPFTMWLAVALFRERLTGRETAGAALIVVGAAALAWTPGAVTGDVLGTVAIAAACLCWAVDNNLTRLLAVRDPLAVVHVKTLGAGALGLALAAVIEPAAPPRDGIAAALLLGGLSYGVSVVLDAYALRILGAAREAAFFATAPFAGALLAVALLGERPGWRQAVASSVIAVGISVMLWVRHSGNTVALSESGPPESAR